MAIIYPFRALRPDDKLASVVASVPYDVVNTAEAKALAGDNDHSFLHVTRPEIDLPNGTDPHSDAVYSKGRAALEAMIQEGTLRQDDKPALYVYALTMDGHTQTGFVLCASVADYDQNIVRKHELTRPDKENDRTKHIEILGAQTGTVFLVHRDSTALSDEIASLTKATPPVDFVAEDDIRHQLWVIDNEAQIKRIVSAFDDLGPIYIADGHHRSAAGSRVAAKRREASPADGAEAADVAHSAITDGFLAVSFPVSEMRILPYNRVVKDLGDLSATEFLNIVSDKFIVTEGKPEAIKPRQFGMYLAGSWYTLDAREGSFDPNNPVERLDVSILQSQLLHPLLGIADPRRDKRIDFVGGIRGDDELERRVEGGWAVAFKLHATAIEELLAIADADAIMPPKSTWFEPKLRDGLFINSLDH